MSVVDKGATGPVPDRPAVPGAGRVPRWVAPMIIGVAVVGAAFALLSIGRDEGARNWYRGRLGGSDLYTLNVAFARLLPFLTGAGVALALLQRQGRRQGHTHTANSLKRHELSEIVTHWVNAAGIGLGLVTAAWLLRWLGRPVSLETTYVLHFLGAGLTVAAVAHHLTYQLVGGGTGLIPRSRADFKNALAEAVSYLGVYRGVRGVFGVQLPLPVRRPIQRILRRFDIAPDPAGKYLATEKVLSYSVWALLIGVVVITGIIKALHYVIALPAGVRQFVTFLHDGATVFLLIFLIIHVAALVLVPRNWPLLKSMFTTRVPRRYVEEHLPRWLEEIEQKPGTG